MAVDRIYGLLGLATKAGAVQSGSFCVENAVKGGDALLVIAAEDASDETLKHLRDMCSYRDIPLYTYGSKDDLGHALGKEMRVCAAVTQTGFAVSLEKLLDRR